MSSYEFERLRLSDSKNRFALQRIFLENRFYLVETSLDKILKFCIDSIYSLLFLCKHKIDRTTWFFLILRIKIIVVVVTLITR